jgi:prolyl oligopeptidase|tara:strand:+ start:593 stop:2728 length:2136 start_codon:yes stop_codon:yes gene_type:complete
MKNNLIIFCLIFLFISCDSNQRNNYHLTEKIPVTDDYFDMEVVDNYRWLEDDMSQETGNWVAKQNETTFDYLNEIPFREQLKNRLTDLWDYEKISSPFREGNYTYFYKNTGLQNQSILYRTKDDGESKIFLDPNLFSIDGTTSLAGISFSKDGSLLAYSISEGGSDWRKIIIKNVENNQIIGDTIVDVKFSGVSWMANEGFYYSSYDKPKGSELSEKTDQHKLYYHKLGTPQSEDELIYGGVESEKNRYIRGFVTNDDRFLLIDAAKKTTGNKLLIKDLKTNSSFKIIVGDYNSNTSLLDNKGTKLFLVTDFNAPNKKIVTVDVVEPSQKNWKDFIPEDKFVLSPSKCGGYFFTHYMVDAISKVFQYDYSGKLIREVKLPGIGRASGFGGKNNQNELYFNFSNYYTPSTSYKYDVKSGTYQEYWKPSIDFDSSSYESKQIFYSSKDGTKVPMIITYKKGLELNSKNPTILYGYGGFNISRTPGFSVANAVWMEQGGVYAVPNIRGGGEYGRKWHNAGVQLKKQNVFDDFIAAAEYLIDNNYTSSEYLAIRGGSNGGLLVGATMTQRPDLMKVALPAVGVLDMLRYHKFTAGAGWAYDYGTSEDSKEMFNYLKAYSPVHNVKNNISYPATLITTGDHDDRVVPAHSFKFAAELQEKDSGINPILIRVETNAGHGSGTPVAKTIDQYADIFGFTLYNMGYLVLPSKTKNKIKG